VKTYRGKLSGPLVDRIDVHVVLPPVSVTALQGGGPGEATSAVRARVERARAVQLARFAAGETHARTNGALGAGDVERVAALCDAGARLVGAAVARLGLSARAYGKVLRVARTIADLDAATAILPPHVAEAIGLRVLDRAGVAVAA
jgi:magnesium chelatase family protein